MIQSLNASVDIVVDGTSFLGLTDYGKIMVGDNGFEFYHGQDACKFIQIPWEEVDKIIASVMFNGRWIPRYAIKTKSNGCFTFASKQPKQVLKAVRKYLEPAQMVQALGFFDVIKRAFAKKQEEAAHE